MYLEDVRFPGLSPFSFWRPGEKVSPFPVRRLYPRKKNAWLQVILFFSTDPESLPSKSIIKAR